MGEIISARDVEVDAFNAVGTSPRGLKERQLSIILSSNPADESLSDHAWIRSVDDIHTFREAMDESGFSEDDDFAPDFMSSDVKKALRSGNVTVYSSYPIKEGVFVTPSRMEAGNYAGNGKVYSKNVKLSDVAWLDGLQGQYARVRKG